MGFGAGVGVGVWLGFGWGWGWRWVRVQVGCTVQYLGAKGHLAGQCKLSRLEGERAYVATLEIRVVVRALQDTRFLREVQGAVADEEDVQRSAEVVGRGTEERGHAVAEAAGAVDGDEAEELSRAGPTRVSGRTRPAWEPVC